jgi:nucleotide-binding universal stress UspA family protein
MKAPTQTEQTKRFLSENAARLSALRSAQVSALAGIDVDGYNAAAEAFKADLIASGAQAGFALAKVVDGRVAL